MILLTKCPLCNSKNLKENFRCTDFSTSKETFIIVSCETCGFLLTNPRPETKNIHKYYDSSSYISHTNKKEGFFNWMYQTVRKHSIKKKVSLLKRFVKTGYHLDIGCGTGEFLYACKKSGFKTKGIEPAKIAREQAIKNFDLDVSEKTKLEYFKPNSFDSISMWHVIEHVEDIKKTISNLSKILKSNGFLIVAVPNHKSWDASFYKEFWAAWDVPIHFWHFSKETISVLFKKYSLELITTKPLIFDSFYISILSEKFKTNKVNYVKSFFIGLISNFFGFFTKNGYSSQIYIFKKP